jgi:hypothetical protein
VKISDTRGKPRSVDVEFADGSIQVSYLPADYTAADLEEIQSRPEEERIGAIVELFAETILGWDLEFDDDDTDGVGVIPIESELLRSKVPMRIMAKVLKAIQEETAPSPEA